MTTITEPRRGFVPGMGVRWLLPLYDPLTKLLGLDRARRELLRQADLQPGHRVLDVGCGTGSFAVLITQMCPGVEVVGLDPDEQALDRARRKARRAGATIEFVRGFSDSVDYPAGSFDRVFSSFMFHHLERDEKERTLREVRRMLKADGRLHLLDFGGPEAAGHGSHGSGPHSHRRLADNDERTILALMTDALLSGATRTSERRMLGGFVRIGYYRAER